MTCGRWSNSISFAGEAIILTVIIIVVSLFAMQAQAQVSGFGRSSAPVVGATRGVPPPPSNSFSTIKGNFAPMHKTPSGELCIAVHPSVARQAVNSNIVNHVVLVTNVCGVSIKVQVCYYQSTSCITVALNGYQKISRTLGVSPASMTDFRYEYRELL